MSIFVCLYSVFLVCAYGLCLFLIAEQLYIRYSLSVCLSVPNFIYKHWIKFLELYRGFNPQPQLITRKLDRGLCLSRTKKCAVYDSRGFKPATPVAGPATLRY